MTRLSKAGLTALVWLAAIAVFVPVSLLVIWCFANRWPWPELLPPEWSLRGFERLFSGYLNIGNVVFSSILLSLTVALISAAVSTMAARAFALYEFHGKGLIEALLFLPIAVAPTVFGMGSHLLFIRLGLAGSYTAVVICHLIISLPFAIRIITQVTRLAPRELEEQAKVLGASPWQQFLHGSLPLIAPGVISAAATSFLMSYTQYFLTMLIGGGKVKTLSVVVMPLITGSDNTISSVYSVLFIMSTLFIFLLFQAASNMVEKITGHNLAK